jgi:hypothetical protein
LPEVSIPAICADAGAASTALSAQAIAAADAAFVTLFDFTLVSLAPPNDFTQGYREVLRAHAECGSEKDSKIANVPMP